MTFKKNLAKLLAVTTLLTSVVPTAFAANTTATPAAKASGYSVYLESDAKVAYSVYVDDSGAPFEIPTNGFDAYYASYNKGYYVKDATSKYVVYGNTNNSAGKNDVVLWTLDPNNTAAKMTVDGNRVEVTGFNKDVTLKPTVTTKTSAPEATVSGDTASADVELGGVVEDIQKAVEGNKSTIEIDLTTSKSDNVKAAEVKLTPDLIDVLVDQKVAPVIKTDIGNFEIPLATLAKMQGSSNTTLKVDASKDLGDATGIKTSSFKVGNKTYQPLTESKVYEITLGNLSDITLKMVIPVPKELRSVSKLAFTCVDTGKAGQGVTSTWTKNSTTISVTTTHLSKFAFATTSGSDSSSGGSGGSGSGSGSGNKGNGSNSGGGTSTPGTGGTISAGNFTDITNHWAKDAIAFVVTRGLFNGTSSTAFSPDASMTRGMFVTVLARLDGKESYTGTSPFTDVPSTAYFAAGAAWASANNIVKGVGNNRFEPNSNITREQICVMLNNYATYAGKTLPSGTTVTAVDSAKVSAWAKDAVDAMMKAGIVNGKPGNLIDPQGLATRAEVATMLQRYVNLVG